MYTLVALLSTVVTATFVVAFVQRRRALAARLLGRARAARLLAQLGAVPRHGDGGGARPGVAGQRRPARAWCATPLLAYGLTGLLYLPWIPILLSQAAHTGAPWAERPEGQDILNGLTTVLGGRGAGDGLRPRRRLRPQHAAGGVAALAAGPRRARRGRHGRHGARAGVAGLAGLAGVVEPLLLGLHRPAAAARRRRPRARRAARPRRDRDPLRLLVQPAHQRRWSTRATPTPPPCWCATASSAATWSSPSTPSRARSCTTTCPRTSGCGGPTRWARSRTPWSSTGATRSTASRRPSRRRPRTRSCARLKPGQKLLAVFPIIRTARWGAPWTSEVRKRSAQWQRVLDRDKRLSRTLVAPGARGQAAAQGRARGPLRAFLTPLRIVSND